MKKISLFLFLVLFCNNPVLAQDEIHIPENPSLDVKIGQMLKIGFRGMDISESDHIKRDLQQYHLGGVVLFDYDVPRKEAARNIESPAQVKKLVSQLKETADIPLLVTIDQEGGRVARLKPRYGFAPTVSSQYLGQINNPDSTRKYASATASALSSLGINVNLAPVVDVNVNPDNPIIGGIERSFSSDPDMVSRHARIFIQAHHDKGIITTLKHFPGHGSSEDDSHLGITDVSGLWAEKELIPYQKLIASGDADIIMTAHIFNENWDPDYPATLSGHVINEMLRQDLGYNGVVMSDDMQMKAIRAEYGLETAVKKAIQAGVDILSFANNSVYDAEIVPKTHRIIKKLVKSGEISEARINESYERIKKLKQQLISEN